MDRIDAFTFLDQLRRSGAVNMFGARPYLQDALGIGKDEAAKLHADWMRSFDEGKTAAERAAQFD